MQSRATLGMGVLCLALFSQGASAELPIGTVAIYSDGDVEKLVRFDSDNLPVWEDTRKRQRTHASTPLIPTLAYQNPTRPLRSYSVSVVSGNPKQLADASPGTQEGFTLRRMYTDGTSKDREWECQVLQPASWRFSGQAYAVNRYQCMRTRLHSRWFTRSVRETRLISYAPALGLVVDLERTTRTRERTRTLEHLLLPGKATYKRIRRLHRKVIGR